MKTLKSILIASATLLACVTSCKDDDLVLVPEWETGVHGYTVITDGSPVNFLKGDPSVQLSFELLWNSIDQANTVEKIELFVLFNEAYIDADGNPKTAKHGGDDGVLLMTLEGGAVPSNKQTTPFSISQADVFALYDGVSFDYDGDDGTPALPVWGAGSIKADRNTSDKMFVDGDSFEVRWAFTTADGRVFDNWGVSVCTEFPGANCSVAWAVVCSQVITDPPGDYTIQMNDSYGDGWNGAAIRVVVDGVPTDYTLDDGSSAATVVSVPPGTTTLTFEFVGGDWDSEVTFTITSPNGNVIAKGGPSPAEGVLTLDLCKE